MSLSALRDPLKYTSSEYRAPETRSARRDHPAPPVTRRSFIELALALGATTAFADRFAKPSRMPSHERRDLYPEGVASGDPDDNSVLLWTRCPQIGVDAAELNLEVSEEESFQRVVAETRRRSS